MEELNEEGGETARLHSGQTKDLQDETSERMCMYCRKNINFVLLRPGGFAPRSFL